MEQRVDRLENEFGYLKSDIGSIKTDVAVTKQYTNELYSILSDIKDSLARLTDIQVQQSVHESDLKKNREKIEELESKLEDYREYAIETGCPQLKASNAEVRNINERISTLESEKTNPNIIADLQTKITEIYPTGSKLIKLIDNVILKISTLIMIILIVYAITNYVSIDVLGEQK